MKKFIYISFLGFFSGFAGLYVGIKYFKDDLTSNKIVNESPAIVNKAKNENAFAVSSNSSSDTFSKISDRPDFVLASEISTASVVFITTLSEYEYRTGTMFDWFFEPRSSRRIGSGSGVIFSSDGYIITNNHVIDGADEIKVTKGKKSYSAELIGVDPSSDLAVIKINAKELPKIPMASSESVRVGEWVLAVGNPFNLTSTVTAGIVSAKGRNINLLKDKFPIESFIQTDAAINPGNSGGALVNQNGELIGINTAILSYTGSYAGYGFAIPIDIVKKVFNDLIKYGEVQKAFVGADFIDIDSDIADKLSISSLDGVIVGNVKKQSAADRSGLKEGDIIRSINEKEITDKSHLEEYLANLYPGDEVTIKLIRDDKVIDKSMTLLNRDGGIGIIKRTIYHSDFLDADFEMVSKVERDLHQIENGIKVIDYNIRGYFSGFELPKGFIITAINRRNIESAKELEEILSKIKGRIEIYGVDEKGRKVYVPFYMR